MLKTMKYGRLSSPVVHKDTPYLGSLRRRIPAFNAKNNTIGRLSLPVVHKIIHDAGAGPQRRNMPLAGRPRDEDFPRHGCGALIPIRRIAAEKRVRRPGGAGRMVPALNDAKVRTDGKLLQRAAIGSRRPDLTEPLASARPVHLASPTKTRPLPSAAMPHPAGAFLSVVKRGRPALSRPEQYQARRREARPAKKPAVGPGAWCASAKQPIAPRLPGRGAFGSTSAGQIISICASSRLEVFPVRPSAFRHCRRARKRRSPSVRARPPSWPWPNPDRFSASHPASWPPSFSAPSDAFAILIRKPLTQTN
jgi:hypothetical protein